MENDFEKFCKDVADLWPRCKTTPRQLQVHWNNCVCYHKPGVVSAALSKAVSEFPDDTAPKWKVIFGYLAGRSERDGVATSEFAILLDHVRHAAKKQGDKGADNMTDEDAWLGYVRAQTFPITHDTITRQPKDYGPCPLCVKRGEDCGLSRQECLARKRRDMEYRTWANYLEEHGESIPAYLSM